MINNRKQTKKHSSSNNTSNSDKHPIKNKDIDIKGLERKYRNHALVAGVISTVCMWFVRPMYLWLHMIFLVVLLHGVGLYLHYKVSGNAQVSKWNRRSLVVVYLLEVIMCWLIVFHLLSIWFIGQPSVKTKITEKIENHLKDSIGGDHSFWPQNKYQCCEVSMGFYL